MSKSYRKDLTGQRFGRLTVLEFVPDEKRHAHWKCRCDCGNITIVKNSNLKCGLTVSCGCYSREKKSKHGAAKTKLYQVWQAMKKRCNNHNDENYKHYGGRGIKVCDEWDKDFQAFHDWAMSNGYDDTLTIDRTNNNGNYEPLNCRWVNMKTQCRNRRSNIIVEYQEKTICLEEAAERSGIHRTTLATRYNKGDRGEKLFRPVDASKRSKK